MPTDPVSPPSFVYSNNGFDYRIEDADYVVSQGEVIFKSPPSAQQLSAAFPNHSIFQQIINLEIAQTPRRVRDAVDGTDGGWLRSLEIQIAALRSQLK